MNKKVLFVVTSHTQLGNTGQKTGYYSGEVTHPLEEIEKAIENYQKNWVNLSFEEQKVRAEKLYQDMQEKLQNKMSNLKIILGIIMLIYAIFHLLRAFRLA